MFTLSTGFFSIFVGTFILEDVALAAAIALAARGEVHLVMAFLACFFGIFIGDVLLYAVGFTVATFPRLSKWSIFKKIKSLQSSPINQVLNQSLFLCRFIPGTRLPTYLFSGLIGYSFVPFLMINLFSVFLWVGLAFAFGQSLQKLISNHFTISLVCIFILFSFLRNFIIAMSHPWQRKAYFQAWRKWLSFEFWPPWFFYLPIAPRYLYLSLKHRSFLLPFYANPGIAHAGLVGESKWDFYKHLQQNNFALKTFLVPATAKQKEFILEKLQTENLSYPFILKPDEGQRGYAVRLIKNETELTDYLKISKDSVLLQEYSPGPFEAGLFYYRLPLANKGFLFSITDKEFPFVIGDGKSKLGNLILNDSRAKIIAATYFERFAQALDDVPAAHEVVTLSTCGNHCQGAIFKNGFALKTEALSLTIEKIAQQIPDFYFGRFDIRYSSKADLMQGKNFKIVEVNGAGSEATHIWDAQTKLFEAYQVLFTQWALLFEIGDRIKKNNLIQHPVRLIQFFKDLASMKQQNKKLRVSS